MANIKISQLAIIILGTGLVTGCQSPQSPDEKKSEVAQSQKYEIEVLPKKKITDLPPVPTPDPCPDVPKLQGTPPLSQDSLSPEKLSDMLKSFAFCMRQLTRDVMVLNRTIEYYQAYQPEFNVANSFEKFSDMNIENLEGIVRKYYTDPMSLVGHNSERKLKLRSSFSNVELEEFHSLIVRRHGELVEAERKIFAAIDARRPLVDYFAKFIDRYALLLALRDTQNDADGIASANLIRPLLRKSGIAISSPLDTQELQLLHPYAILSTIPAGRHEKASLDAKTENPFKIIRKLLAEIGESFDSTARIQKIYTDLRDRDNPPIPFHVGPVPGAVRVAMIDTGLDFVKYPELTTYLNQPGIDRGDVLTSWDYADDDPNPWAPAVGYGELNHGTISSALFFSVISRLAPGILLNRKIEFAMWKTASIRRVLQGNYEGYGNWENRLGIQEAIFDRVSNREPKPQIVATSTQFPIWMFMNDTGKLDLIKKAPWLWVMSAGNDGENLDEEHPKSLPDCFQDIPPEYRNDQRILCVGALAPGVVQDRIASYSNYGQRVDVYTYDSYSKFCPAGTTCAAQTLAAVAAIVAEGRPLLTPEDIKGLILQNSDEKSLPTYRKENEIFSLLGIENQITQATRRVRVFDPETMMSRLLMSADNLDRARYIRPNHADDPKKDQ